MEEVKKLPDNLSEEDIAELSRIELELERREKLWPIKDAVPNIAQQRALKGYLEPHPTYPGVYPFILIFRAGNGVGKTCALTWLLAGVSLGRDFMNPKYFPHKYFDYCQEIRRKRKFKIRIVCDKADMQENGSVYEQIVSWIPIAKYSGYMDDEGKGGKKDRSWFEGKTSGGYYTTIRIPAPSSEYKETVVDIKTFDQDTVAHAGPDYDLILFNEPPPQDKYNENIGRLRTGGRAAIFLTPLDAAEYLRKVENGDYPDGELVVVKASIWDNCKDIPGNNGVLEKYKIESLIRSWQENNELEIPARVDGEYVSLAGRIYPIYNQSVHEIDPMPIQSNWNIYKIIDPHMNKPPFCTWVAVTPLGFIYVIAEYPTESWPSIKSTHLTIEKFVEDFKLIEMGKYPPFNRYILKPLQITECLGDPNLFKEKLPNSGKTLQEEYEQAGCEDINLEINDSIAYRHQRVRSLLYYDIERKISSTNRPFMYVYNTCKNISRGHRNYAFKAKKGLSSEVSEVVDKTWMCPMDTVGYFAAHYDGYQKIDIETGMYGCDDQQAIDNSRRSSYINNECSVTERFI